MIQKLTLKESMQHLIERSRDMAEFAHADGVFGGQLFRDGELILEVPFLNGVTVVGKHYMLDGAFNGGTMQANWYLGLIDGTAGTPTISSADIMSSHTGWTEFVTYGETTRQIWTRGAAASSQVVGTESSVYTIGAVGSPSYIAGGFVTSANVKGGTSGVLWSTGLFANAVPVQPTDVFKLGYLTGL